MCSCEEAERARRRPCRKRKQLGEARRGRRSHESSEGAMLSTYTGLGMRTSQPRDLHFRRSQATRDHQSGEHTGAQAVRRRPCWIAHDRTYVRTHRSTVHPSVRLVMPCTSEAYMASLRRGASGRDTWNDLQGSEKRTNRPVILYRGFGKGLRRRWRDSWRDLRRIMMR